MAGVVPRDVESVSWVSSPIERPDVCIWEMFARCNPFPSRRIFIVCLRNQCTTTGVTLRRWHYFSKRKLTCLSLIRSSFCLRGNAMTNVAHFYRVGPRRRGQKGVLVSFWWHRSNSAISATVKNGLVKCWAALCIPCCSLFLSTHGAF